MKPSSASFEERKSVDDTDIKFCRLCFESGAQKRPCCNAFYCDHCYVKNERCPNCNVQTKQEKLTGATYQLKIFSEHEECRVCLDPGILRRCCGNYYCDKCYYKSPTCRSCGTIVSSVREERAKAKNAFLFDRAYVTSVCLGWLLTIFLVTATLCFFAIIAAAELQAPVGINDYTCYGFFRNCEVHVCIDLNKTVAEGIDPLPPLNTYTPCTLDSVVKLEQPACIFDSNLYHQSQSLLGYDICLDSFSQNHGVYIFQDNFENWQNLSCHSSLMKSALWSTVENGFTNSYCGSYDGSKSLSFRGEVTRVAETQDLDISSGGVVDGWMFMPPLSYDVSNPYCRPGYHGVVNLDYSINRGANWTTIQSFDPQILRSADFFHFEVHLPDAAATNQTRIRFNQPDFVATYDNWALDNVRVLRHLPNNWQTSSGFISNLQKGLDMIQYAQCCADTDWCSRRLTTSERSQCTATFGWFDEKSYLFRLSEILICVTVLLNVIKFLYLSINNYLIYGHFPFHEEVLLFLQTQWLSNCLAYLPLEYRIPITVVINQWINPTSVNKNQALNETVQQIHQSARLQEDQRQEINDLEGQGLMLKSPEEIQQEREAYYKKIARQKKKLAKRMKKKNFKASTIVIEEDPEYLAQLENHILPVRDDNNNILYSPSKEIQDPAMAGRPLSPPKIVNGEEITYDASQMTVIEEALPDNLEKMRRQNIAMLRIPFAFDSDDSFRWYFCLGSLGLFTVMFLLEFSILTNYTIEQPIEVFGQFTSLLYMNGFILTLFAAYCDFKEIYYCLKNVIPCSSLLLPLLTVDLSEDNRSFYIGDTRIPLAQIKEITAFPKSFILWHFAGVVGGAFPYCLFSLLLREAFLNYSTMRFVTPLLGAIMIFRAVLGPLLLIKTTYAFQYIFARHFTTREIIGRGMQKNSSLHLALNVSLGLTALGLFFCALTSVQNLPYIAVAGFFGGGLYGLFTGTAHELSIKPWICESFALVFLFPFSLTCISILDMTMLRGGVYLTLRKRQVCPCVYWGAYCTEAHNYDEVLILFTKDDLRLINLLNGGAMALVNG